MTVMRKAWEHRDEALDPALGIREGSKKGGEVCFKNEERIYPKAQRCKYAIYILQIILEPMLDTGPNFIEFLRITREAV